MTLKCTQENAAILMADPVTYFRCEDDQPLRDWLNENEELLMHDPNHRNNILHHGLCIITGVYRTPRCTIGQWRGRGTEISIELDVGVFNQAGAITGGGSWKKIAGGGYWKAYGFDPENPERMYDTLQALYRGSSTYLISENNIVIENYVHALEDDSDERGTASDEESSEDTPQLQ
ncbi:hypothetical protein PENSUB_2211 [Penicillium subrubescens]|uniref:Uncharacterized protein n=2 Tax=Penicillium subrubescens TaxID=1316194 RepID=A0A1Q5URU2_9EURO|nr:hypothetical protein PENSUB_2211 [Penicillium subrubescens]